MVGGGGRHCVRRAGEECRQAGHRGYGNESHQVPPVKPCLNFKNAGFCRIVPAIIQVLELDQSADMLVYKTSTMIRERNWDTESASTNAPIAPRRRPSAAGR